MTILPKKKSHLKDDKKPETASHPKTQAPERNPEDAISSTQHEVPDSSSNPKRKTKLSPLRTGRLRESKKIKTCAFPEAQVPLVEQAEEHECNSEDEYERNPDDPITVADWIERDQDFEVKMNNLGFIVKKMKDDGACLFRAVADQVFNDQEMHHIVRKQCMDYISINRNYFSQYMTEDIETYLERKRRSYTHGNHIEIQALCELYNRPIKLFRYDEEHFYQGPDGEGTNEPIRLAYQRNSHFNSVVDPFKTPPPINLQNFTTENMDRSKRAENSVLKTAVRQSEDSDIEQTMLQDKMQASDWEATTEAIEEQVARESYLQWVSDNERRMSSVKSPSAVPCCSRVPSPSPSGSGVAKENSTSSDNMKFLEFEYSSLLTSMSSGDGSDNSLEEEILFQSAIAASQTDFFENLKNKPSLETPEQIELPADGNGNDQCEDSGKGSVDHESKSETPAEVCDG